MASRESAKAKATCPTCDRTFATDRGMRSHHTQVHDVQLPNRECADCGVEFHDEHNQRKYCRGCYAAAGTANPDSDSARATGTCIECETSFEYYPSEKPGYYCPECVRDDSIPCVHPDQRTRRKQQTKPCAACDAPVTRFPADIDSKQHVFCDRACYSEWLSEKLTQDETWANAENPNWQGGTSAEGSYGSQWPRRRKQALRRDNFTCQQCGITDDELGQNPDVHHITPVRTFDEPSEAHSLDNLICLCRPCHISVERGKETL